MSTWAQIAAARSTNPALVERDDLLRERSTLLKFKPQVSANVVGGMGGGVVSGDARSSLAISDFNASATGQRVTELTNEAIRRGYITPRNDGGFGWGLRDAFLNPAVLAAVGGYFFTPASGASAADTATASDAGTLYAPSAAGVDTAAASDAGMLYAPAAASSTPLAPAAGSVALKGTAAGTLVNAVKDVGQVVGAVAGIAGAASAVRRATSFANNPSDTTPTTPAGILTPATQAVPGQGISSSTLWIIAAVVGVILFRS